VQSQREVRSAAAAVLHLRAAACEDYRSRVDSVSDEFGALADQLHRDLRDASISPYRRNALRLLQARLEDARERQAAFQSYCEWYLTRQDRLFGADRYQELIAMQAPMSRLPEDWYYAGKVGLISAAEIGTRNAYGQQLDLRQERIEDDTYSDAFQRALLMQHPQQDEIPVQLFGAKNRGYFKACVMRGALYVEHILERLPCEAVAGKFRSNHSLGPGYDVQCFPSFCETDVRLVADRGVRAFLPQSEMNFPGKRYVPGARLDVLLHHHDLRLQGRDVTVTQHVESLSVGTTGSAPIVLTFDVERFDMVPLLQEASARAWHLREFSDNGHDLALALQLGSWQVELSGHPEVSRFEVQSVTHVGIDSVELDELPFPIRLVDARVGELVHVDALRFDAFRQFCRQLTLFAADEESRRAGAAFFHRWDRVTDYLLDETGYRTFHLKPAQVPPSAHEQDEWACHCTANLADPALYPDNDAKAARLTVEALYTGDAGERWLQVAELQGIPRAMGSQRYGLPLDGFSGPQPVRGMDPAEPVQLRLRIPNGGELANLTRQKRALQGFMGGRLLNRKLQQVLLMPARYEPEPAPAWQRRVDDGLVWANPHWQDPAAAAVAKRIVEAALVESNLYLMQGPPGTGKTTCIIELLHQLYQADPDTRILVVSQQNTAVDNALGRYLERFPEHTHKVLRIGRDAAKVHEQLRERVTDSVLSKYLMGRQQHFSQATVRGDESQAAWVHEWMDRIYRPAQPHQPFDEELTELLVGDHPLVGATCVGLASRRHGVDRLSFDVCIIDEGGRSTVPELLIPLMRSRKAIVIGDHFQLPPSVARALLESEARVALPFLEETFLKTSFFEQLYQNLPSACRGRLVEQFRMVEPIGDLVAELFYSHEGERGLFNGLVDGKPRDRRGFLDAHHPLRWCDVPHGRQRPENPGSTSLMNEAEAQAICEYLVSAASTLRDRPAGPGARKSVAVITPYGAQKRLIRHMLEERERAGQRVQDVLDIEVDTVDSFQGSETDIVLYATVRTEGNIRFLLDRHRLNVACSRARENLVFFGCARFLSLAEANSRQPLFRRILERCGHARAVPDRGRHQRPADRRRDPPRRPAPAAKC
jgi:hypothetical protein